MLPGVLVGRELTRGVPDPASGDAGVGDAGEPFAGVLRGGQIQGPLDDLQGIGQQYVPHEHYRPFFQDAGGLSGLVKDDPAAVDLLAGVCQSGGAPQALAVELAGVAGGVLDPHRLEPPR